MYFGRVVDGPCGPFKYRLRNSLVLQRLRAALTTIFSTRALATDVLETEMKRVLSAATTVGTIVAAVALTTCLAEPGKKEIVGLTADEIRWFTPPYYVDGRQRAQLFGDSSQGGTWIDRVKIPGGARVLAHTHPQDELVTVIEGTWYLGGGAKFDSGKLKGYPAGSFIVIPAGIPHFVAAKEGTVVVQLSGIGKFQTKYLEK
jgi:anti-sigma factor ChrR (cupin superfamily)